MTTYISRLRWHFYLFCSTFYIGIKFFFTAFSLEKKSGCACKGRTAKIYLTSAVCLSLNWVVYIHHCAQFSQDSGKEVSLLRRDLGNFSTVLCLSTKETSKPIRIFMSLFAPNWWQLPESKNSMDWENDPENDRFVPYFIH